MPAPPPPRDESVEPPVDAGPGLLESVRTWASGAWLTDADWGVRHRAVLRILWAHVPALFLFGIYGGTDRFLSYGTYRDFGLQTVLLEVGVIAVLATLATWGRLERRLRSFTAALGLVTCSAVLVQFSGGYIEAHFHFFVMVGVIAMYLDWVPFLTTIAYVTIHHGVIGVIAPESVYNHPAAFAHPWRWALIHALFILSMALTQLTQVTNLVLVDKKLKAQARRDREMKERARGLV